MTRVHHLVLITSMWNAWSPSVRAEAPRPELAAPRRFVAPRPIESSFANGFKLTLVPYGTTPTARVEIVIRAGSTDDPDDQLGIAELVGEYLREGSRSLDADSFAREVAELGVGGGEIGVVVNPYQTLVSADVLSESVPALLHLLCDTVLHPAFPPAALPRLATNQIRRISVRSTQAATIAATRTNSLLFPNHPADRTPTPEGIRALTLDDVRRFHAAHFVCARVHLYVAGRFEVESVQGAARKAFVAAASADGTTPIIPAEARRTATPSEPARSPDVAGAERHSTPTIHLLDRPGTSQARIQISTRIVDPAHPDHPIINQLNILLGSVQTSRIIANVRERHGYSYNVSSRLIRRPGSSQWALTADVANDVTGKALQAILAELARVVAEPPAEDELRRHQAFLAGVLVAENATPAGILETLRYFDLHEIDPEYRANFVERVRDVLPSDIQRVARTYFQPGHMVIVVVGDRRTLTARLAPIGKVTD